MNILAPNRKSHFSPGMGTLLIAEPYLSDPGFFRSVILLCEHGDYGTLGFVLNQPSSNTVNMLLPELRLPGINIFNGGPVQTDALQIIHRLPDYLGGIEVMPGVFWGASYEELADLCRSGIPVEPASIRLFRGYSGWDTGQLEEELKQNAWITAPAQLDLVFDDDSKNMWARSLQSLGEDFSYLANLPENPILN